ncbi:MAG: NADH-quinone oxidoreductase subunit J [Deltaproteobacteria bacterium]|nr:NADH-quinone oxidoreductase subunit J [Deltaproteobacteria bacterium]
MTASVGFGFMAACTLVSAIFVVRSKNLIRAALWLGATLLLTAALYAMLDASFLAGVQVLLYVGGISTLLIFGVMMTRKHEGLVVEAETVNVPRGVFAAGALFGGVAAAIKMTPELDSGVRPPVVTANDLGRGLLIDHVLAFEVVSLLLLVAIIGAVVIARKRDPGAEVPGFVRRPLAAKASSAKPVANEVSP